MNLLIFVSENQLAHEYKLESKYTNVEEFLVDIAASRKYIAVVSSLGRSVYLNTDYIVYVEEQ